MKVVTNQQHYYDIAEVIRAKTGITTPLKPAEMAPALAAMTPADALPHAEEFTFGANLALPVIPDSVLAAYPKAVIFMVTSQESTQFVYIAAASTFYRVAGELLGMEYDLVVGSLGEGVKASDSGTGTWGDQFPVTAGTAGLMIGTEGSSTYSLVWANHDIYEVLDIDAATGSITTGAVYFAASNTTVTGTADDYRIQNETLDSLGEEVNRLCNTVEPMAPERMTEKLQNLDITLQDIVITPSDEEQIIKPEGHYGFSKIIVEAVEDSGTSGGGGTGEGGDGGDTGNDYLDADNVSFGYEEVEVEVPTGNYTYSSGITIPAAPNTYGYHHWWNSGGGRIDMVQSSAPLALHSSWNLWYSTAACSMVYYRWKPDTESWDEIGSYTFEKNKSTIKIQGYCDVNYTVNYYDKTGVFKTPTTLVAETKKQTVLQPIKTAETYTISGDSLSSIGQAVYKITGTTAANPSEMAEALNAYYLTINPTEGETTE